MRLNCPKCRREGYLRVKWIWGSSHFRKLPYWYVQHTKGLAVLPGPSWCYLGKMRYWIDHRVLSVSLEALGSLLPNSLKDLEDRPGRRIIEIPEYLEELLKMVDKARERMEIE